MLEIVENHPTIAAIRNGEVQQDRMIMAIAFGTSEADRYQAVILITGSSGVSWQIRTGWIVLFDSDIARFVTAFSERFGRQQ